MTDTDFFVRMFYPGHLALLERVFLVLDGAAPSLSQLCGLHPEWYVF